MSPIKVRCQKSLQNGALYCRNGIFFNSSKFHNFCLLKIAFLGLNRNLNKQSRSRSYMMTTLLHYSSQLFFIFLDEIIGVSWVDRFPFKIIGTKSRQRWGKTTHRLCHHFLLSSKTFFTCAEIVEF